MLAAVDSAAPRGEDARVHGSSSPADVRWATPDDLAGALACYERNGYGGGIAPGDRPLVAVRGGHVVGCVRLVEEHGLQILRGLFIDEAERGQGLGGEMLDVLCDAMARVCWLICGAHLVGFYAVAGFRVVLPEDAPTLLAERAAGYAMRHGEQAIMRRVENR